MSMGKYSSNVASLLLLIIMFLTCLLPCIACPSCPPYTTPPPLPPPPPKPVPVPVPVRCPPPPKAPAPAATCPIDTLKLGACVDLLAGLVHAVIGPGAKKKTCCPVLERVADLDAALCLCTTIRAKLLDVNIFMPIALEMLVDCGKYPPKGYQCPA